MPWGTRARIPSVGQDRLILPIRPRVIRNVDLLKVRRTLMSIEYAIRSVLKVRRTLMLLVTMRVLQIKDLKDLSVFFRSGIL